MNATKKTVIIYSLLTLMLFKINILENVSQLIRLSIFVLLNAFVKTVLLKI